MVFEQTLFYAKVLSEEGQSRGVGVMDRDNLFRANLLVLLVGRSVLHRAKQRMFVSVGSKLL